VYALGINIGAGLSAATAVPLADAAWGWRGSLTVFSVATALLAVVWLVLTRGARADSVTPMKPAPLPWRSRLAWLFVTIFVLMAVLYYGVNAWLPDTYVERGWSEEDAAWLVAVLNVTALPWTIAFAWIADRIGSRRLYLGGGSAISAIAMLGFIFWPEGGFLWAVVLGVAAGAMFPLAMTLPLDVTDDPARVGAVAGMMLGVGYGLGALSPLILGGLRDATGSFTASLWMIAAATIAITVLCLFLTPARLERGVQFET
jgi:CP family cyanate transporter-like MFS transporter